MDASTRKIIRMIDKMTEAGWIARSASREDGGVIQWTDDGKAAMAILHALMFKLLRLKPGDESVLAWMVSDFHAGLRRCSRRRDTPPSSGHNLSLPPS
jgi:DNA-binding MarR family transcriptional regulator